jgi:hypothetical protein
MLNVSGTPVAQSTRPTKAEAAVTEELLITAEQRCSGEIHRNGAIRIGNPPQHRLAAPSLALSEEAGHHPDGIDNEFANELVPGAADDYGPCRADHLR